MRAEKSIYVDFDDVLCETAQALRQLAKREYGRDVAFRNLCSFDIGVSFGLAKDQIARLLNLIHDPDTLRDLRPMAGARDALRQWAAAGYAIHVVTGRPPATCDASLRWLRRHDIPFASCIFVDKYARRHPSHGEVRCLTLTELQQRNFCLAIDDSPEMIRFLVERMRQPVVVFGRPWNAGAEGLCCDGAKAPTRCRHWKEIIGRFPAPGALPEDRRPTPHAQA